MSGSLMIAKERMMTAHPNRSRRPGAPGSNPKPADLIAFREEHGLSQGAAAALAYSSLRTWQNWESGDRRMHPAIWAWVVHSVLDREIA